MKTRDYNQKKQRRVRERRRRPPRQPTNSWPGSRERIEVYRERWRRGLQLHHPEDMTCLLVFSERILRTADRRLPVYSGGEGDA